MEGTPGPVSEAAQCWVALDLCHCQQWSLHTHTFPQVEGMHPVILTLPMGHFLQSSTPTGACPLLWVTCHFYHPGGPVLQGGPAGGKEKGEVQGHWEVMDRKPELYRLFPATRPVRDAGRVLSPTVLVGPRHTDPFVKGFFFFFFLERNC